MKAWFDAEERDQQWQIERLPELLHALARALRAGLTLQQALHHAGSDSTVAGDRFRRAAQRVADGSPVLDEVDRWAADLDDPDADLVRAVVNTGAATGSALAASFERAAGSVRERSELQREIGALTAQARASALMLTLAPYAVLAVVVMADASVVARTFSSSLGRIAMVVGLLLDGAGWAWMRQLTRSVAA